MNAVANQPLIRTNMNVPTIVAVASIDPLVEPSSSVDFKLTTKTLKNIYHYVISVVQDASNPNKIWIYMQFIPIGHMEFAYVEMGVGVYEDLTNFAEV